MSSPRTSDFLLPYQRLQIVVLVVLVYFYSYKRPESCTMLYNLIVTGQHMVYLLDCTLLVSHVLNKHAHHHTPT